MTNQDELLLQAQRVIRDLRGRLAAREHERKDPVAIVGMACRFPCRSGDYGGSQFENTDAFWAATLAGANPVRDLPPGRWEASSYPNGLPAKPPFRACFLEQPWAFDADFFGISSCEAAQMDPAQSLFLEVSWHALEDAGQTRRSLAGSDTAVFAGNTGVGEFLAQQLAAGVEIDVYTATGAGLDVIAGRLSYLLDLQGPCATINTACSSSLVALHLARRSLLAGECSMAIVGGVNVLGPVSTAMASRMDFLAPDGRCKPFDERADGFGRGEGCGVVILKRLSEAVANHDRILAVIQGSAMNQDGSTNGLTAPSGRSQAALLRRALKDAGIHPSQVGYLEAHGTGTPLGDPIEVEAISEVLGNGATPCGLGSAKGNIGHLEGGAGIAGVIRTVMIMQNGVIPPVANFHRLNPHISLDGTGLFVPSTATPWPRQMEPRYAGVSSFGWSGTNAHVILGEPPPPADAPRTPDIARGVIVPVSAANQISLRLLTESMARTAAQQPEADLPAFAWSAGARRSHHAHRLAVAGDHRESIVAKLLERAASTLQDPPASAPEITLFFAAQRADSSNVIAEMVEQEPVFKNAIERGARELKGTGTRGSFVSGSHSAPDPTSAEATTATFLLQFGLTELLKSWGIRASNAIGEGTGSVMAALANGTMDISQACTQVLSGQTAIRERAPLVRTADRAAVLGVCLVVGHEDLGLALADQRNVIPLLRPGLPPRRSILEAVAALYEAGTDIAWDAISGSERRIIPLPAYPFRHPDPAVATSIGREAPDAWFYETGWPEIPIPQRALPRAEPRPSKWIIVPDKAGFAERLIQALSRSGDEAVLISPRASIVPEDPWEDSIHRALETSDRKQAIIVVHLLTLDLIEPSLNFEERSQDCEGKNLRSEVDAVVGTLMSLVELCRALAGGSASRDIRLWVATRGAIRLPQAPAASSLAQSPLWGFSACVALEHPDLWGGIVDLHQQPSAGEVALFIQHVTAQEGENRALLRGAHRHVARLRQAKPPSHTPVKIDPEATYLITGAFGGIGPSLAEWLVQSGAKHLVLLGRRPASPIDASGGDKAEPQSLIGRWQAFGVTVQCAACDVADFDQMALLVSQSNAGGHPIRGILHAAADVVWKPLIDLTLADLRASFHAKAEGSLVLHELSKDLSLDFLAFFSSAAVTVGARGASAYAAANSFMDSLARQRCDMGLPALSLQWGNWQRNQAHVQGSPEQFARSGFRAMPPELATNALGRLLAHKPSPAFEIQKMVAYIDRSLLKEATAMRERSLFLSELDSRRTHAEERAVSPLVATLLALSRARRIEALTGLVVARVRHILGWTAQHPIDQTRGFFDMGFDSLKSIELKTVLSQATGLSLSSTLVMTYPNINALTEFLHASLFGEEPRFGAEPRQDTVQPTGKAHLVAEDLTDSQAHEALAEELRLLHGRFDV